MVGFSVGSGVTGAEVTGASVGFSVGSEVTGAGVGFMVGSEVGLQISTILHSSPPAKFAVQQSSMVSYIVPSS